MNFFDRFLSKVPTEEDVETPTSVLERELEAIQEPKQRLARLLEPTGYPLGDGITGRRIEDVWTPPKSSTG